MRGRGAQRYVSSEKRRGEVMSSVTLYTGGCRSGKSTLAVEHACGISENICFIATCVPQDDEMKSRVEKHQRERPACWRVIEEPLDLAGAIRSVDAAAHPAILVDCLTLWVCNLMCRETDPINGEKEMAGEAEKVIAAARQYAGDVIFVSNEVGMGIMPANAMARNYGDLAGRCNQVIAKGADRALFVSCGIAMTLK